MNEKLKLKNPNFENLISLNSQNQNSVLLIFLEFLEFNILLIAFFLNFLDNKIKEKVNKLIIIESIIMISFNIKVALLFSFNRKKELITAKIIPK